MFGSAQLYEVYYHPGKPEEEATVLVRQGFSFWAFLFHAGWLFYHRLRLEGALFLVLYVAAVGVGEKYGLNDITIGVLQLALQFWLGTNAADLRAAALERKGFVLEDVIAGPSAFEAERRYYYTHKRHA